MQTAKETGLWRIRVI